MKKLPVLALLFVLCSASTAWAQLYFCASYTDNGDPIGIANTFSLSESGGYVYMLYSNKQKVIHSKTLNIVVTKQWGKDYVTFGTATMVVQDKKTWAVADFHFTAPGTFKVSIQDNGRELAKNFVSVFLKNGTKTENEQLDNDPEQGYYDMTVSFCTGFKDSKPVGLGAAFTTGLLTIFLDNTKALATDTIVVMLYKKAPGSDKYDQYYDFKKYGIGRTNNKTYFEWTFTEDGSYAVEIYNRKLAKMGTGYVTIEGSNNIEKDKDPDQSYYNAKTTFCESVADGQPVKSAESFRRGELYVYVFNDKALLTDSIVVDIMKKAYESDKYNIYIATKDFSIKPELFGTYFPLELEESGKYKISIYNRKMQRISDGFVTIR